MNAPPMGTAGPANMVPMPTRSGNAERTTARRGGLFAPWRHPGDLLRAGSHVALSLVMGIVGFTLEVTGILLAVGLMPVALVGLPVAVLVFAMTHWFANVERARAAAFDGRAIADPVAPLTAGTRWGRIRERMASRPRWREVGYATLLMLPGTTAYAVVAAVWGGSIALLALPATIHAYPDKIAHFYLFDAAGADTAWLGAAGLVGVAIVAPWVTVLAARLQVAMAHRLLGPGPDGLRQRVAHAESGRSAAVDAAEAERRRIERDLHDGAQQRLVALAADLGAARERMEGEPGEARELVARAHEEAKGALREIRDLVRGIHPVILQDRGLDAALSAVVARCSVPVSLDVDVPGRLPAAIESAAYFVVAEALTNVTRHSQAAAASVSIAQAGNRLVIEVRDNGVGGADASAGTGLQGLRDRVTSLKGVMFVISPAGGPTTVSVELPCAS